MQTRSLSLTSAVHRGQRALSAQASRCGAAIRSAVLMRLLYACCHGPKFKPLALSLVRSRVLATDLAIHFPPRTHAQVAHRVRSRKWANLPGVRENVRKLCTNIRTLIRLSHISHDTSHPRCSIESDPAKINGRYSALFVAPAGSSFLRRRRTESTMSKFNGIGQTF